MKKIRSDRNVKLLPSYFHQTLFHQYKRIQQTKLKYHLFYSVLYRKWRYRKEDLTWLQATRQADRVTGSNLELSLWVWAWVREGVRVFERDDLFINTDDQWLGFVSNRFDLSDSNHQTARINGKKGAVSSLNHPRVKIFWTHGIDGVDRMTEAHCVTDRELCLPQWSSHFSTLSVTICRKRCVNFKLIFDRS